jgi:hypothetical protein
MSGNLVGALKIKSNFVGHLKHPSTLVLSPNPERTRQGNHFSLITAALRAAPQGPGSLWLISGTITGALFFVTEHVIATLT